MDIQIWAHLLAATSFLAAVLKGEGVLRQLLFSFPTANGLWKEIVMFRSIWRFAAPVAAFALFGMVSAVRADTVTFTTSGVFSSSGTAVAVYTGTLPPVTLTFTGMAATTVNPPPDTSVDLGSFLATGGIVGTGVSV